jgi:hypothetical protein
VNYEDTFKLMMKWWTGPIKRYTETNQGVIVAVIVSHPTGVTLLGGPQSNRDYLIRRLQAGAQAVSKGDRKKVGEITAYELRVDPEKRIITPN